MPRDTVSIHDLAGAADWLRAYENADGVPIGDGGAGDDDDRAVELLRVAAWIDAEIARRHAAATERQVARGAGVSLSDPIARRQVRRAIASAHETAVV